MSQDGGRKGPIPAVAIKETCGGNDVLVNGHSVAPCNGGGGTKRLEPADDEKTEETKSVKDRRTFCEISKPTSSCDDEVIYSIYQSELNMPDIMRLIQKDLSEPYSIYTYRYFIHNWPNLCFMVSLYLNFFQKKKIKLL